jgi:hypothetical protein
MRKFLTTTFILLTILLKQGIAQTVNVNSTTGTTTFAQYYTLKAAFDSINVGYQTGIITIQITGNTSEGTSTAKLDSSGKVSTGGTSSYTSITITPVGGSWTISGNTTGGNPLIDLNGADNVTIDGLANGTDSLTIANTTSSTTSNTSTIRLINDATNNTLTNLKILTSFSSSSLTTNGGAVYIGTAATNGSGNDNNTISNCYLSNAGSTSTAFAYKLLYINGTTTDSVKQNNNILIDHNHFVNFRTSGVYVNTGSKDITIINNHFYHDTIMPSTSTFSPIFVSNLTSGMGENFNISGNYIGGSAPFCGGSKPTITSSSYFQVIYLRAAITGTSYIDGNTIANMNLTTNVNSTEVGLIYVKDGKVNIGSRVGNLLGSTTDTSNLIITNNSTSGGNYAFISLGGNIASPIFDSIRIENNKIGGITINALNTNTPSIRGFDNVGATGTFIFRNNSFGIPGMANSIQVRGQSGNYFGMIFRNSNPNTNEFVNNYVGNWTCYSSVSTNGRIRGISLNNTLWITDSNLVENLVSYTANAATAANVQAEGIYISGLKGRCVGNTVRNIIAANPTSLSSAMGIEVTVPAGATGVEVAGNKVSNIYALSADTSLVVGIRINGDAATKFTVHNNQISLGKDSAGADYTAAHRLNGILQETGNVNFYYNSILIDGNLAGNTVSTYAFNSASSDTTNIRNNVFSNQRSFGSSPLTSGNFAANFPGTITTGSIPNLTTNYNLYYANGIGGMVIANSGTNYFDLTAWKSAAYFHDANSVAGSPDFISYNLLQGGMTTAIVTGDFGLGINIDITNTTRVNNLMGAYDMSSALPVDLLFFNANKEKEDVILTWATASEMNNKGFYIERSVDGVKFESVGFVKGYVTTSSLKNYSFNDLDAFKRVNAITLYYRLKQVDNDGQFDYSKTVSVSTYKTTGTTSVYPNPFKDIVNLTIASTQATTADVCITDLTGKVVSRITLAIAEGNNTITLDNSALETGMYVATVIINSEKHTVKLIKQ